MRAALPCQRRRIKALELGLEADYEAAWPANAPEHLEARAMMAELRSVLALT